MKLPPRPPLNGPPSHPNLIRYGVTWDGSPNQPLLTLTEDGYWTPWHIAADLVDKLAHRSPESLAVDQPPPLPAEDKVKELVNDLIWIATRLEDIDWQTSYATVTHAATLLRQQAAELERLRLQPVPVSSVPLPAPRCLDKPPQMP